MSKPKIYVVAGATASGKTDVGIALAKKLDGVVISADSLQIYEHISIATAKPTTEEMQGVIHHMLSVARLDRPFSVKDYVSIAQKHVQDAIDSNKIPIIVGGTGFYINALLYGIDFTDSIATSQATNICTSALPSNEKSCDENTIREKLNEQAQQHGAEFLHNKLKEIDHKYAETVHPKNIKKVVRALAFYEITGKLFSEYNAEQKQKEPLFDTNFTVLSMPRNILYERINTRAAKMWREGLLDEARMLKEYCEKNGLDLDIQPMRAIGYKEALAYDAGLMSESDAIAAMQQATRNYAKRQETWFRHQAKGARWVDTIGKTAEEIADEILAHGA